MDCDEVKLGFNVILWRITLQDSIRSSEESILWGFLNLSYILLRLTENVRNVYLRESSEVKNGYAQ
jgi:hypothetical protein